MNRLPELLAPAGSWEALVAAVSAGADAVYLGGKRYGARAYAENFEEAQLIRALEYAHRSDVKVYVTVNTLLTERELPHAAQFLLFLYEQGADGVLVQDAGLIRLARHTVPHLPLHASTQMTIHSSAGVQWAQEMGLRRVVLARELTLQEISLMAGRLSGSGIGLEVFIHGALCYSYSGQCLLSSSIGGRSGNRGRCAQPCRKPFHLVHGSRDGYDRVFVSPPDYPPSYCLSTRDLCTYQRLDELVRLSVESLKIEGRMKSPEYVATVVRIYRHALDAIGEGSWEPREEDVRDLLLAFNRGFTRGHLFGERVMGAEHPDHQGIGVGTVSAYEPATHMVEIKLTGPLIPETGDGLCFVDTTGSEWGMRVTRTPLRYGSILRLPVRNPVITGATVFITHRGSLGKFVARNMKRFHRQIPVDVDITWEEGRALLQGDIHRRNGTELSVRFESPLPWVEAKKKPLSAAQIQMQLQKSGGTPYEIRIRHLNYTGGLFLPLSAVNTIRREFLEHIGRTLHAGHIPAMDETREAQQRLTSYRPRIHPKKNSGATLSAYVTTAEGMQAAIEGGIDCVCMEAGWNEILASAPFSQAAGVPLVWMWPRIIREAAIQEWVSRVREVREGGVRELMVSGPGAARAVQRENPGLRMRGNFDLNVWNHCSAGAYTPLFHTLVLSPELSQDHIRELVQFLPAGSPRCEIIVQGNLEVMVSDTCPDRVTRELIGEGWGILDQRDRFFPIIQDPDGRTHIYNSVETCYIDHLPALLSMGIESFAIDARYRSPDYVREITGLYRKALNRIQEGRGEDLSDLKEQVRLRTRGGITLGPLVRGLKEEA